LFYQLLWWHARRRRNLRVIKELTVSDLRNQAVVVSGGTGALGTAVVAALVERGADCFVPMREPELPEHLASLGANVHAVGSIDLTRDDDVRRFYAQLPTLRGSVHLTGGFAMKPALETLADELERMLKLNLVSAFLCCREAAGHMPGGGAMINVGARPAVEPVPGMAAYVASKAGLVALTKALAVEWRDRDIRVNAILPSIIDTPSNRQAMPDADHDSWPKPEQIAETIVFLLSDHSRLTSGALVPVYGRA
jgi:NAD(P)-dependent dehydrogenase (short-subunit alcohol dehydrogenase family)